MNSYDLSRNFWNWAFDNPEKVSPNHAAVYFFAIEHCNRLGWKKKFGFPSQMTMDAIGIKKHSTYIRYFNDLVEFGFFTLVQKSHNQYSSNIISLTSALPKKGGAMDKAILNHREKQTESNGQSKRSINKQLNNLTTKQLNNKQDSIFSFNEFWEMYNHKKDRAKTEKKYDKLNEKDRELIKNTLPNYIKETPDVKYRKHPSTYLNNKSWLDEECTEVKKLKYKVDYINLRNRNKSTTFDRKLDFTNETIMATQFEDGCIEILKVEEIWK